MLKRYAFVALVLLGITLGTAVSGRAQYIASTLDYDGTALHGFSETLGSPYDGEWPECVGDWLWDDYYEDWYCDLVHYHEPWVETDGYIIVANNATPYWSATDYWPTFDAFVPYYIPYPFNGTWLSAAQHWVGDDVYEQYCWGADPIYDCDDPGYIYYEYDLGPAVTTSDPPQNIQHLTYATYNAPLIYVPGCMSVTADPGIASIDFQYTWNGEFREEDNWPNGQAACITANDTLFFGTYHLLQAKSSRDLFWTDLAPLASFYILTTGFALPPQVTLTLDATGVKEDGKDTHYISLINTGNVVITANVDPPQFVTWNGGIDAGDNLHRIVNTATAGDTQITASVPDTVPKQIMIHVVDATAPPAPAEAARMHVPDPAGPIRMRDFADFPAFGVSFFGGVNAMRPDVNAQYPHTMPMPSWMAINGYFD